MINLLIVPIQSFSDIVTNSSSELFVTDTKLTEEQVFNVLKEITTGFEGPIRFSLNDYRKALSNKPNDLDIFDNKDWGYGSYYGTAEGWFIDLEGEYTLTEYRMRCVDSLDGKYYKNNYLFLIEYYDFLETLGYKMEGERWCYYYDIIEIPEALEKCKIFFQEYEKSGKPLPSWWNPDERETLQYLDGKVLIISEGDNTIPFETFDIITELLNGFHIHLG